MKQVLLMAVLAAGMLLTACSKDSEDTVNRDMEKEQITKKQELLNNMKEHIVGTWEHDGDFMCKDYKEIDVVAKEGIADNFHADFNEGANQAVLTFGSDGKFELKRNGGYDESYTGTYSLTLDDAKGLILPYLRYNATLESPISDIFGYRYAFFEKDYNTLYLIYMFGRYYISRYRRL
jgi:opacity protein-like surface antigen